MMTQPRFPMRIALLFCALASELGTARGFLGIGDVSFVTVIANPAEAANWAADLEQLNNQLEAAKQTLQVASDLRTYAGDPKAALASLGDLGSVTGAVESLVRGVQTDADLVKAWQTRSGAQRLSSASTLLQASGAGSSMEIFGQQQARNPSLYQVDASDAAAAQSLRGQIASEQTTRASIATALTQAWAQFRTANSESSKQAILTEISQLQSQDQVMDARRKAILDDLDLADRQDRTAASVRSKAEDERDLAESALLNADLQGRAEGAETQRVMTLQKTAQPAPVADYSGMKLWTTADAGKVAP